MSPTQIRKTAGEFARVRHRCNCLNLCHSKFYSELEKGLLKLRVTVAGWPTRKVSLAVHYRADDVIVVADMVLTTLRSLHMLFGAVRTLEA